MNYRGRGLRTLGLAFLAMLGLMAFMAAGAQAGWLILGKEYHGTESVEVNDHVDGLLLVPGKNLEILCHQTTDQGIIITALTLTEGDLVFEDCLTFSVIKGHLLRASLCDPTNEPIEAGGKGHLVLHEGDSYVLFEPDEGPKGIFTIVEFGEECALTETSEITGSLVGECGHLEEVKLPDEKVHKVFVELDCGTNQSVQLVREALVELFKNDGLFFGENKATIDGIASAKLDGPNAGEPWGGHV